MLQVRNLISPLVRNSFNVSKVFLSSSSIKEEKIKVGEWNINYVKVGNGPHKVLCLPGALGTIWNDFKPQVEGLDRDKMTVVAWDPPGYGKSRPPLKEFTPDFYEKDAKYAVDFMKALNIPKFSLLGFSDGGITSIIIAAKYPKLIEKMAIWGANSFILPNEAKIYQGLKDIKYMSKGARQRMTAIYGEDLFPKYWAQWVEGMVNLFNVNKGNICSEMLKDVKCPTLIMYGEKDPMVDSVHASHLHTNIEGSRLHLYPDGKHFLNISHAEDFNRRVEDFITQSSN